MNRVDGVLQLPVVRTGFQPAPSEHRGLGRPTGIRCPRCQAREVVYNGNYFCAGFGDFGQDQECGWALPHIDNLPHWTEPHHVELQQALIDSMTKEDADGTR